MKGQATIEFLLVLVICLAYIAAIVQPNVQMASDSMADTAGLGKLRASADKLANSTQYAAMSASGTKETLQVVVPQGASLICDITEATSPSIRIQFTLRSKGAVAACMSDDDSPANSANCNRAIPIGPLGTAEFSCTGSGGAPLPTAGSADEQLVQPGIYSVSVEKLASGDVQATFNVVQ